MDERKENETQSLVEVKKESQSSQLISDAFEERSSSSQSSPPIVQRERIEPERLSPSRKRSHEEMNVDSEDSERNPKSENAKTENVHDSSSTAVNEELRTATDNEPNSDFAKISSTSAHTMPPPPLPVQKKSSPSEEPPQSAQGSQKLQPGASTSGQQNPELVEIGNEDLNSDEAMSDDADPSQSPVAGMPKDKIEDFDWLELHERYHTKMEELNADGDSIMAEFEHLCKVNCPLHGLVRSTLTSMYSSSASGLSLVRHVRLTGATNGTGDTSLDRRSSADASV